MHGLRDKRAIQILSTSTNFETRSSNNPVIVPTSHSKHKMSARWQAQKISVYLSTHQLIVRDGPRVLYFKLQHVRPTYVQCFANYGLGADTIHSHKGHYASNINETVSFVRTRSSKNPVRRSNITVKAYKRQNKHHPIKQRAKPRANRGRCFLA